MPNLASPDQRDQPVSRPATRRVQLARAAATAIDGIAEVSPTIGPHGRWRTGDGTRFLDGVVAIEGRNDRVELALHLDVKWPPRPLAVLADEIRLHTTGEAKNAKRDRVLGEVRVFFHDVIGPPEPVPGR